jgi:hypothetical protein
VLGFVLLASAPSARAQTTVVETFDGGSNEGGWTWSGPSQSVPPSGGNPGPYLYIPFLDTFAPQPRTAAGLDSEFTGSYQAAGVASIGIDLITFDVDFSAGGRPLSLMLMSDAGTPGNGGDDWGAYIVGPDNIPLPGEGWLSYDFAVPSQAAALPPGWVMTGVVGSHTWAELMGGVDYVQFFYGDPDFVFIFQGWELGLDNPRIVKDTLAAEPGRVPTDMLLTRVTASQIKLFWSASPCAGAENYAIYEGEIGQWYSHGMVTCTDLLGDLEERILTTPGNHYYLVVPLSTSAEGSYGLDSSGGERPPATTGAPCEASQSTACP